MKAHGDCYEAAGKYMMDNCIEGGCNLILVHGEVTGQGDLEGVKYGHAWVEDGSTVIDKSNGRDITLPKVLYYSLAKIGQPDMEKWGNPKYPEDEMYSTSQANLHKYTWAEAREKITAHEHWGPWDLKTSSGL